MKRLLFTLLLCLSVIYMQAQVGINQTSPHSSAALEINGGRDKGLLIPFMDKDDRGRIKDNSPANGLLVYDPTEKMFYYFNGSEWIAQNPLQAKDGSTDILKLSNKKQTIILENNIVVKDSIKSKYLEGYGVTPVGGIIMWNGDTAPDGWVLCIGGTVTDPSSPILGNPIPDLRKRFVAGYDNIGDTEYSIGKTGGSANVILQASNLPTHKHAAGTLVTSTSGTHTHTFNAEVPNWDTEKVNGGGAESVLSNSATTASINSAGAHTHTITGETADNASQNLPHENRPPYYVLAFIMRVK